MWTRTQIAVAGGLIVFGAAVILAVLSELIGGSYVAQAAAVSVAVGAIIWLVDFISERWPKKES